MVDCLEALPVDDGGTCLIILLLADPHLLEGGQGSQDGATDPDRVLTLRGGNDLVGKQKRGHPLIKNTRSLWQLIFCEN